MPDPQPGYVELQVTTNYSFLRGASQIEELIARAALFGFPALGIADRNTLAGIPRAHQRAEEVGIRLIPGCRLDLKDGASVLVYPTDRPAWSRLTRLLTLGKSRAGKGACDLAWADLAARAEGLIAVLCEGIAPEALHRLRDAFADRAYVALTLLRRPDDAVRLQCIADLARKADVRPVATGDVLYHAPGRRILQDVLTCIRHTCTIDELGFRREASVDRHLHRPEETVRRFARHPDALQATLEIADRCRFSLDQLSYQYPQEMRIPGLTAQQTLDQRTWQGAADRYPEGVPEKVVRQLRHELALIEQLGYAPYFLTVDSIVRFARSRGILCQGRGSAANSAVCYVLGITSIDPTHSGLLFERFVSAERKEPPDIDVDFEHEQREEVIQWVYDTYGRDRAALCATVIRYRGRGAVRDIGKAMGMPEDITAALAGQISHWGEEEITDAHVAELNLNPQDRRLRLTIELSRALIGFPRHLSQHPGGFVLTEDRLDDLVPIEPASMAGRQVIEWDKDDVDSLRFMKVDVLGLGMLGCLRRAFDLLARHRDRRMSLADIPQEDPATYAMIRKADTLGTFQIESRAQMSMLPRLKPRTFYDLVIQVAIVRPGPIQGDMVHPYLRRREGLEPVEYPTEALREVLGKTLGVPLFQEQAMQVAIVCAGFTPGEADALRRSMATFKFTGGVHAFRDKMIGGMVDRDYTREFAEQTFSRIEGFGSYGFPESHAASFALIAYASAWLKCHHPDVFCCALLNAQPMGFYAPAQIVRDAREHRVEVREVCVNASSWDCTLEPAQSRRFAVRLGLRMARGLKSQHADALVARRGAGYHSVEDVWRRTGIPVAALERLAEADAFRGLAGQQGVDLAEQRGAGLAGRPRSSGAARADISGQQGAGADRRRSVSRRDALWAVKALSDSRLPLFEGIEGEVPAQGHVPPAPPSSDGNEPLVVLPPMTQGHQVVEDYRSTGLSLRHHPVSFLRADLAAHGIIRCADLATIREGRRVTVAGLVLVRQRPGSARGVLFVTIEDETGHANLIVWPSVFEAQRRLILSAGMLACRGKLQRESGVTHVIANRLTDLSDLLRSVERRDGADGMALEGQAVREIHVDGPVPRRGIRVRTRDFR